MSICPACNGTGPLGAVLGVVCPRCGGSGVVSDAAAQAETKGGETMSDSKLKVTVDVANVPAVVQILKEAQEAIDALRAELAAAQEENARLRGRVDYLECALNGAESDTHKALSAFNELDAKLDAIPWDAFLMAWKRAQGAPSRTLADALGPIDMAALSRDIATMHKEGDQWLLLRDELAAWLAAHAPQRKEPTHANS